MSTEIINAWIDVDRLVLMVIILIYCVRGSVQIKWYFYSEIKTSDFSKIMI